MAGAKENPRCEDTLGCLCEAEQPEHESKPHTSTMTVSERLECLELEVRTLRSELERLRTLIEEPAPAAVNEVAGSD